MTGIVDVVGSAGDDILIGSDSGGDSNDVSSWRDLRGLAGDDTLVGSRVIDHIADYRRDAEAGGGGAIFVNLPAGVVTDGFGDTDTVIDITNFDGTASGDLMLGDDRENDFSGHDGADTLSGGGGDDALRGGAGADLIDGGEGDYDQIMHDGGFRGIIADLEAGAVIDQFGDTDTVTGVEHVRGTEFADVMRGNDVFNNFRGLAGADTIDGRGGRDEARYDRDASRGGASGVTVNLAAGFAIDGFGDRDTLIDIEDVVGSGFADVLIGDDGYNRIRGGAGADILTGGGGADVFRGAASELDGDLIMDFDEDDVIEVAGASFDASRVSLILRSGDTDILIDLDGDGSGDLTIGLKGDYWSHSVSAAIEGDATAIRLAAPAVGAVSANMGDTIKGGSFDDVINGRQYADIILSGDGDDTIFGGDGNDTIKPGRGNDVMDGGAGDDILVGFRGDEVLIGGAGNDTLLGNLDDDTITGGAGDDRLQGGPGRDVFVFDTAEWGHDRIVLDFLPQSDTLDFRGSGLTFVDLTISASAGGNVLIAAGDSSILINSARFGPLDVADFTGDVLLFG
ncbi:calcium-binding protein [Rubrimonas cliftonensis]|uniref:calcium-binding protein n=1 Tax=Rubrimonas cliftonensis TaxID=89524 RepID=UPI000B88C47A|nr:calcium-binding protein [Rubrimonas cliftonensis]